MNGWRWIRRIGLFLIAAGCVVLWAAWKNGGATSAPALTMRELDGAQIASLTIEEMNQEVQLIRSENDSVFVGGGETEQMRLELTDDGQGNILLRRADNRAWYEMISFWPFSREIPTVVALPDGYAGSVSVTTSNGKVMARYLSAERLDVKTSNADVILENISLSGGLTAESSNGQINARNLTAGGSLLLTTSNADLTLYDVRAQEMTAQTSNGRASAENTAAEERMELTTSNGEIVLDRVSGVILRFETSNGGVTGTIAGDERDYEISGDTSNGEVRLPEGRQGAPGSLQVKAGNGDIHLEFID